MTKITLDTNAYSGFMAGNRRVFDYIVESQDVFLSTIVVGDLFAGFYGGRRFEENKRELKEVSIDARCDRRLGGARNGGDLRGDQE